MNSVKSWSFGNVQARSGRRWRGRLDNIGSGRSTGPALAWTPRPRIFCCRTVGLRHFHPACDWLSLEAFATFITASCPERRRLESSEGTLTHAFGLDRLRTRLTKLLIRLFHGDPKRREKAGGVLPSVVILPHQ
jgi:hypothetical protein